MAADVNADRLAVGAVGTAAVLLATVAYLGKRIEKEAAEIADVLNALRDRTDVLFDLPKLNFALDGIAKHVKREREEG